MYSVCSVCAAIGNTNSINHLPIFPRVLIESIVAALIPNGFFVFRDDMVTLL